MEIQEETNNKSKQRTTNDHTKTKHHPKMNYKQLTQTETWIGEETPYDKAINKRTTIWWEGKETQQQQKILNEETGTGTDEQEETHNSKIAGKHTGTGKP